MGLVIVAGGIGGFINSLLIDKGLELPHVVAKGDGTSLLVPGFIGNILTGAIAAGLSWLLYGPNSQATISANGGPIAMTLATLGGAVLVGMAGAGWLTNAFGKSLLRSAAVQAAQAQPSPAAALKIATASPQEALKVAQQMQGSTPSTNASSVRTG